jgi:23S rRNA pseudouridine2457 synthase
MTAAVGHPTLRLVRAKIGTWELSGLAPGQYRTETLHLPQAPRATHPKPSGRRRR